MRSIVAVLVLLVGTAALAGEGLLDPDPTIRRRAAEGLSDPAAVPALAIALGDPDPAVRKAVAEALQRIGPKAQPALEALVRFVEEENAGEVRTAGIRAVATIEARAGNVGRWLETPLLRAAVAGALHPVKPAWVSGVGELLGHRSWYVRAAACRILRGGEALPERVRGILRSVLQDPSPVVRMSALMVYATATMRDEEVLAVAIAGSADPNARVHRSALSMLAGVDAPGEVGTRILIDRLRSGESAERRIAVCALRRRSAEALVATALRGALQDEDGTVRREAAIGLAFTHEPELVAPLMEAFRTASLLPDLPVVYRHRNLRAIGGRGSLQVRPPPYSTPIDIARALAALAPHSTRALAAELKVPEVARQANAIWTMGMMGDPPLEVLEPVLSHPDARLAGLAAIVLARDPPDADAVARALVRTVLLDTAPSLPVRDWSVSGKALWDAFKAVGSDVVPLLVTRLDVILSEEKEPATGYYDAIAAIGPPALPALPALVRAWPFGHRWEYTRGRQHAALLAIGAAARPVLTRLAESPDEVTHQSAAEMLALLPE